MEPDYWRVVKKNDERNKNNLIYEFYFITVFRIRKPISLVALTVNWTH